ncbi:NAD(P)/FAD-dependent oxidoreductase [Paenarthrobacter sp. YJN-5]|uniref:flavin monoamine oxidase family protein n=1 Tax=Paenarthrobacter sp. YJN-5 TaxID=2735316 RepID=UPI00187762AB|nr:NAD(P)/FAD-dependent oxidoreductase [Paenarthrobacter sp. YJN-5]QOT15509.1 FAD-dependent oxidoreductase [Paenarthrobacter sp. YJN-5]
MYDVAVIGGGPAGLAAAYNLERAGQKVVLLEETNRLGGRAKTVEIHGEPVNMGAMFVYSGTASHELALELGVPLVPFEPKTFGLHVNGETVVSADNGELVGRLPLSEESKAALLAFIERAGAEYFANTVGGQLKPATPGFGDESAQSRIDDLPDDVQELLTAAIRGGSVAHPTELSATYALRYFASYLVLEKKNRMVSLGGMQAIPAALAASLEGTDVRMSHRVESVHPNDDGLWTVEILPLGEGDAGHAGLPQQVTAKHVIMAVPAPRISSIAQLPEWKCKALDAVRTPGSTELGVVVDISDPTLAEIDDWAFIATAGRVFDVIINPRPGRGDGTAQFVCYGNSAGYIPEANDPSSGVLEQWLEEFLAVAPQLRGRITGASIQSWQHCFSLLTPTRAAALKELQAPVAGTLHFAGDYSSETAGTHGAYAEAKRVSDAILSTLSIA